MPRVRAAHTAISYVCQRGATSAQLRTRERGKGAEPNALLSSQEKAGGKLRFPVSAMTGTAARPAPCHAARPRRGARHGPGPRPRRHLPPAPRSALTPAAAPSWRRLLGGTAEAETARPPSPAAQRHCGRPAGREGRRQRGRDGGKGEGEGRRRRRRCPAPPRSRPAAVPALPALSPEPPPLIAAVGRLRAPRPSPVSRGCAAILEKALGASFGFLSNFYGCSLPWRWPAGERGVLRDGKSVRLQRAWEENLAKICTESRYLKWALTCTFSFLLQRLILVLKMLSGLFMSRIT